MENGEEIVESVEPKVEAKVEAKVASKPQGANAYRRKQPTRDQKRELIAKFKENEDDPTWVVKKSGSHYIYTLRTPSTTPSTPHETAKPKDLNVALHEKVWDLIKKNEKTHAKAKKANQRYKKLMRELHDDDENDDDDDEKIESKVEAKVEAKVEPPTPPTPPTPKQPQVVYLRRSFKQTSNIPKF
jgi:hypothetical protein